MRVPTLRALPVGRRNWLEDFDATCAADENTMGISVQNNGHRGAFGCEHRFPDVSSQRGGNSRIDGSDEGIHLQQSQPEVEKDFHLGPPTAVHVRRHRFRSIQTDDSCRRVAAASTTQHDGSTLPQLVIPTR